MAAYWVWWILAGGLVIAELVTGTFLLLALGVASMLATEMSVVKAQPAAR